MRMFIFCVYHSVFHFIAYNIKPPASSQFLNGRLTIEVLKPKRLCVHGSKGFRLWELSKSKNSQLQSNRFEQKKYLKNNT